MIKQIFLDMDGTLLDEQGGLTENTVTTIIDAKIPVTLVSARAPQEMIFAIQKLALTAPQVAFNGGLIYQLQDNHLQVIHTNPIASQVSIQLVQWLAKNYSEMSLSYYTQDNWFVNRQGPEVDREILFTGMVPQDTALSTLHSDSDFGIFKIMLIDLTATKLDAITQTILDLNLPGINVQQSDSEHLEITSAIAEKAFGVTDIMTHENLSKSETAAFGDGYNDLSMFGAVGTAIAMGNAPIAVQQAAQYVTKPNTVDGVAYGIKKFLLQETVKKEKNDG